MTPVQDILQVDEGMKQDEEYDDNVTLEYRESEKM